MLFHNNNINNYSFRNGGKVRARNTIKSARQISLKYLNIDALTGRDRKKLSDAFFPKAFVFRSGKTDPRAVGDCNPSIIGI